MVLFWILSSCLEQWDKHAFNPHFFMCSLESRQGCSRVDFLCHRNHRCIKGKTRCAQRACLGLHILLYRESSGFMVHAPKASSFFPLFEYVLLLIFRVPELGGSRHRSGCLRTGVFLCISSHVWKLVCMKVWLCTSKKAVPGIPWSFEYRTCNLPVLSPPWNAKPSFSRKALQIV